MKAKRFVPFLWTFIFSAVLPISSVYCLTSSFGYPVNNALIPAVIMTALLFSLMTLLQKRWVSLLLSMAVFCVLLYPPMGEAFVSGMFQMGAVILKPVIEFYPLLTQACEFCTARGTGDCLVFLFILAAVQSLILSRFISDGYAVWPALILPITAVIPCFLIVEYLPDMLPLLVFVSSTALLVLTQQQRRYNRLAASRLCSIMVIPVAALTILIAAVWPKDSYERPEWPDNTRQELIYRLSSFAAGSVETEPSVLPGTDIDAAVSAVEVYEEDLSKAGPRQYLGIQVMQVKAPDSGTLYLRGTSYAQYSDNVWYSPDPNSYPELYFSSIAASASGNDVKTLSVRTVSRHTWLYTPYYLFSLPEGALTVNDSFIYHPDLPREYSLDYCADTTASSILPPAYEQYVSQYYTQVPDELWNELFDIAYSCGLFNMDQASRIDAVAQYVKNSAEYDLNTPAVPEGEDFVLWFLKQSDTGYCVHFATAACMLLRTVDIPARYVTGYMAVTKQDQWSAVTDSAAHAWVEYYVSGVGWVPLEVTPESDNAVSVVPDAEVSPENTPQLTEESETIPEPSEVPPAVSEEAYNESTVIGGADSPTNIVLKSSISVWPVLIVLIPVLPFARRAVILAYRKKRYDRCSFNSRALLLWTRTAKLAKALDQPVEKELYALAQKARFSQHTLNMDELSLIKQRYDELQMLASEAKLTKQLWYKYVLVLY